MNNSPKNTVPAMEIFSSWKTSVMKGQRRTVYAVTESPSLRSIEIAPKQIALFGGAPGAGKTAFVMQLVIDGLRLNPTLHSLVCNVEMPPEVLLDRQLARLSGIPLDLIRDRKLAEYVDRLNIAFDTMEQFLDRLCFLKPPFGVNQILPALKDIETDGLLLVLDYLQRIEPIHQKQDKRANIDSLLGDLRRIADAGIAVIAVSSIGRQKNSKGRGADSVGQPTTAPDNSTHPTSRNPEKQLFPGVSCGSSAPPTDAQRNFFLHAKMRV